MLRAGGAAAGGAGRTGERASDLIPIAGSPLLEERLARGPAQGPTSLPGRSGRRTMIPLELLTAGYESGWFPMAVDGRIRWFSPDPRAILPLDGFHVPSRLARTIRQGRFEVRLNAAFRQVIEACAAREDGTWISAEIVESYGRLHEIGLAHSVEAWHEGRLAGGLYGVSLGGVFFGESMFHRVTDASKVALHALVQRLRERGYRLLDVQWLTPHLEAFGACEIPRRTYLSLLAGGLRIPCRFVDGD